MSIVCLFHHVFNSLNIEVAHITCSWAKAPLRASLNNSQFGFKEKLEKLPRDVICSQES